MCRVDGRLKRRHERFLRCGQRLRVKQSSVAFPGTAGHHLRRAPLPPQTSQREHLLAARLANQVCVHRSRGHPHDDQGCHLVVCLSTGTAGQRWDATYCISRIDHDLTQSAAASAAGVLPIYLPEHYCYLVSKLRPSGIWYIHSRVSRPIDTLWLDVEYNHVQAARYAA
jgi:hypothetical protein